MIAPLEPGGGNGVVFFAGGGTGGHLFPALAVAEVLARDHGHEPCFLTGPRPLEREILGRSPFPRHEISIAGRGRSGLLGEWRRAGELFRNKTLSGRWPEERLPTQLCPCAFLLTSRLDPCTLRGSPVISLTVLFWEEESQ